jgi:hypothetical protein
MRARRRRPSQVRVRDTLVIIDVSSSSRIGSGIGIQLTLFEVGELAPVFMIAAEGRLRP